MSTFKDSERTVEITMKSCDGSCMVYDFSDDFFSVGEMEKDEDGNCLVDDVSLFLDLAREWQTGTGDCADQPLQPGEMRVVGYEVLEG